MEPLNRENFNYKIEEQVRDVINKYELLKQDDKIAVALSGGKDSILTMFLLDKFRDEFNIELIAIFIDEGIKGYREDGLKTAHKYADLLKIELIVKSFEKEFNLQLDQIQDMYKSACIPCGVFRRYLLNKTANQLCVDKLATGHNLDDEVQSYLMSFVRADFRRFSKFGPKLDKIHPNLVPRIKPLWRVAEKDVGIWAILNGVEVHFAECPYAQRSLRGKLKDYLNKVEEDNPGMKLSILKSFEKTFKPNETFIKLLECEKCGEPSSLSTCKACEMLNDLKNK